MSIFVIGDRDTVLGFRLLGAEGRTARSLDEARDVHEKVLQREDIKLLFLTREWADRMRQRVDELKMKRLRPLVMEIPGKEVKPPEQSLSELVRRAIGINL